MGDAASEQHGPRRACGAHGPGSLRSSPPRAGRRAAARAEGAEEPPKAGAARSLPSAAARGSCSLAPRALVHRGGLRATRSTYRTAVRPRGRGTARARRRQSEASRGPRRPRPPAPPAARSRQYGRRGPPPARPAAPPHPRPSSPRPRAAAQGEGPRSSLRPLLKPRNFPQLRQLSCALTVRLPGLPRGPSLSSSAEKDKRQPLPPPGGS